VLDVFRNNATIGEVMGVIRKAMGFPYDQFEMASSPDFLDISWCTEVKYGILKGENRVN